VVDPRNNEKLEESKEEKPNNSKLVKKDTPRSRWPAILLVVVGLLLIISSPALLWLFRDKFAEVGPQAFIKLWYGAGGLAMLDFTAGLPLGAILLALGGARLSKTSGHLRRLLLLLLGIYILYFIYHAFSVSRYSSVPFSLFAAIGVLFVVLFLMLVWFWMRGRSRVEPKYQRSMDLQMGSGLCFFTAAWEACGLVGAPGFAVYPELAGQLGNQSFLVGQALAVQVFIILGFILLMLGMRAKS
jgi:hypothetical protein